MRRPAPRIPHAAPARRPRGCRRRELLAAAPASAGGFLYWLFHHDVQAITSTDALPVGALYQPATPSHPVYYVAVNAGYRDYGAYRAGDKLPAPGDMVRVIVRALAKQSYLPADDRHPPTEVIAFAWGTLLPNTMPNPGGFHLPDLQLNRWQMLRFLGGDKLGLVPDYPDDWTTTLPGLTRFNPNAESIDAVARDDLYVVALAGYQFPLKPPRRPQLLWRTKISCPARGLVMADTLPVMVVLAAPYIGRETGAPVWVDASDKFKPDIRIGNPKLEEYLDSAVLPVDQNQDAAPKSGRTGQ